MNLAIRYAILSYCSDLTDPDADARPVALVGVGGDAFGFFIVSSDPGDDLGRDTVSTSVLNGLPALLQRQLREGLHEVGGQHFLAWLHDRYRNSLSVSKIASAEIPLATTTVEDALNAGTIWPPLLGLYRGLVRGERPTVLVEGPPSRPMRSALPPNYGVVTTRWELPAE